MDETVGRDAGTSVASAVPLWSAQMTGQQQRQQRQAHGNMACFRWQGHVARSRQQASIVMASPGRKLLKGKRFDDSWFSVSVILFLHPQYPTDRFHVRGCRQGIINTQCYFRSGPQFFLHAKRVQF